MTASRESHPPHPFWPQIDALLTTAARVDRVAKGGLRGDAWVALESLVARIAGVGLAA